MLKPDARDPDHIHLTATERAFARASEYDGVYAKAHAMGSLHYLDAEREELTTLRALVRVHAPQLYEAGATITHPLSEVLTSAQSGECVHPGEAEVLEEQRRIEADEKRRRAEAERKRVERLTRVREVQASAYGTRTVLTPPDTTRRGQKDKHPASFTVPQIQARADPESPAPLKCGICGRMTTDWFSSKPLVGLCNCRDCLKKGLIFDYRQA